jgi:hypothetical protein
MVGALATRLDGLPRGWVLAIGLVLTLAIAVLDYVTGPRILLNIFYLLPVMLVAWATASTGYGLIVAAASCLVHRSRLCSRVFASTHCPCRCGTGWCGWRSSASCSTSCRTGASSRPGSRSRL